MDRLHFGGATLLLDTAHGQPGPCAEKPETHRTNSGHDLARNDGLLQRLRGSQGYPLPFMSGLYPDRVNFIALAGNLRSRRLVKRIAGCMAEAGLLPSSGRPSRCCREPVYRTTGRSGRKAIQH